VPQWHKCPNVNSDYMEAISYQCVIHIYIYIYRHTHIKFRINFSESRVKVTFIFEISFYKSHIVKLQNTPHAFKVLYTKSLKTNYTFIILMSLDIKSTYSWIPSCNISQEIQKAACCLATSQNSPSILDLTHTFLTYHKMLLLISILQYCKNVQCLDFL
jgi:hypothetical protein